MTEAAWSPDDRRIAFAGTSGVFVINSDRSGQRRLGRRAGYFLEWSPDGMRLAFATEAPGGSDSIRVVELEGALERLVTGHAYIGSGFGWRPDGHPRESLRTRANLSRQ